MARRDRGTREVRFDEDADGGGLALDTESAIPPTGPHDSDGLDPEVTDAAGLVDFGSIRVPVPPDGTVTVEPTTGDRMQAVHIRLPEGRLSVSALAAPKTSKLWPELSREIDGSLREGGARVRSFPGEWGRELHATSGGATSVFVGVDGPRWMLYGVATGPSAHAAHLDAELRRMLRGTVVARGKKPFPVRTILPLAVPDHLAAEAGETPAVPAAGVKKRSSQKAAAGKSAPGKTAPGKAAPGKTAPPNSDAASAAAKKAAARRAAARKAAAAAAVKAAAEALAEQAAEDRAAAGERPDTRGAARNPAAGTIPTGPGPDAPLREQAPSARRAAAAAWRAVEENAAPPPTEALPVARPVEESPVTEAFPLAGADVPPTEALPVVGPGAGGRRRPAEADPVAPPPSRGRRHLPERPVEQSYPGGRRRLREPVAETPPPPYPREQESGRRRLQQPDGALGSTAPWDLSEPGGRRRLREPDPGSGGPASGRRQQREPGPDRVHGAPPRPAEPFDADQGVSASGRRRLREPWDGAEPVVPVADTGVSASGRRQLREPSAPVADSGVSASGRRHLREPWDEAGRGGGPQPWETTHGRPNGSEGVRRPARDQWDADPADSGVSASGRRRLREWDDAAPVSESGVSASGRRRTREPWEQGPGEADRSGGRRRLDEPPAARGDAGVSGTGRRRLRESWDGAAPDTGPREPAPRPPDGSGEYHQAGVDARFRPVDDVSASGRRRMREPLDDVAPVSDAGVSATGRRRLREPWEEAGPEPGAPGGPGGRRRLGEPAPVDHGDRRRREADAGDDLISGTGGRRRLREPAQAPVRDGSQTEPWLVAPDGPLDGSPRRTLGAQYLIDTGEQDAGWATDLGDYEEERRDGGRHSGADDASDTTVRLQALLNELDPNRPRRRHRR